jgi:uncharacterized membrane protein YfcA
MDGFLFMLLGLTAGMMSGFLGIGGGLIMVPVLVYFFKFNQHLAQGTSLAVMIPPIGLLAAYRYWTEGHVNLWAALWICLGFVFGGLVGAQFAHLLSATLLKKVFGGVLLIVSLQMIFGK